MATTAEHNKKYYEKHKEKLLKKHKLWYQNNKEEIRARTKAYYENNKEACSIRNIKWKMENSDKFKASQNKWTAKNPKYTMYHNAKRRARELNLPFEMNWKEIFIPTHCPILGIVLWQEGYRDSSASLDRINPKLGYVKGNIKVISLKANRIKAEGTAEEHEKIADYIRNPDKY